MKNLHAYWLIALLTIGLNSCTIELHLQVNKDYSGNAELKVDVSQMINFAMAMDSIPPEQRDSMILSAMNVDEEVPEEVATELKTYGITDMQVGFKDEKFIAFDYHFDHLDNAFDFFYLMDSTLTEEEKQAYLKADDFIMEDNRLIILFSEVGWTEMITNGMNEGTEESDTSAFAMDMSFMTALFTLDESLTFERPIKEVIAGDLPITVDGPTVRFTTNLAEYLDTFVGRQVEVVFE